ncbi:MAG TPA: hypothetical protein VJU52_06535, partial [Flavobacterium sp.]|nr:hypothetical protein [Flavobacterium sp.]
ELQFIGTANEKALKHWLFENPEFSMFIAPEVVSEFYGKFVHENPVYYSHAVSMLLTLSLFSKQKI